MKPPSLDWAHLRVFPLSERTSLTRADDILKAPDSSPPPLPQPAARAVEECAQKVIAARRSGGGVILMYGAHLLRNGAALVLKEMMTRGWLTHLATNGAGTIHDWEYAWLGRSTESVRANVVTGTFGTWDETSRNTHLALMAGGLRGEGYGTSMGRYIAEDGCTFPTPEQLQTQIAAEPSHPLTSARADLLNAMCTHQLPAGRIEINHRWKHASVAAQAFLADVPFTAHPGIGYDIISNHPMFNGGVIGRAATLDFRLFGDSVETLDNGVLLSVGSAIMAPQVFEKSLSCVNNLRIGAGRPIVKGHSIYVVDLQDGGNWDWNQGEPPKTNAAYYLRFCKSYARMGGAMQYVQCDNMAFMHNLYARLAAQ
ncbi:MAG: hypothetical protein IT160_09785 [Bryobacterales bacterium]|nr:hypothetical protein [Bryobacterales bacterium]